MFQGSCNSEIIGVFGVSTERSVAGINRDVVG